MLEHCIVFSFIIRHSWQNAAIYRVTSVECHSSAEILR